MVELLYTIFNVFNFRINNESRYNKAFVTANNRLTQFK